jgi:hypothetical protein
MLRKATKRELIEPHRGDKRYVRRKAGKFTPSHHRAEEVLLREKAFRKCRSPRSDAARRQRKKHSPAWECSRNAKS